MRMAANMQPFGHRNVGHYFLATLYLIAHDLGLYTLLMVLLENRWLFLKMIYVFVTRRTLLPFSYQSNFSQRCTDFEFILVQMLKYYYENLQQTSAGYVFFDGRVFLWINKIRRLREFGDGLGDTFIDENEFGIWVKSQSRKQSDHDVMVFYIPGLHQGHGHGHIVGEYLQLFTVALMEQGFHNPAIFVPRITTSLFANMVDQATRGFAHAIESVSPDCQVVTMSDSLGSVFNFSVLKLAGARVGATILVSPIVSTDFAAINSDDYMTAAAVAQSGIESDDIDHAVGDFFTALPENVVVSVGTEESHLQEIQAFISRMKSHSITVKVDQRQGHVHNWALITFYAERLVDHRENSVQAFAGMISRMLLWKSPSYIDGKTVVKDVVMIDEEYT